MTGLTRELLLTMIDEARLAPSVHNIQPTRWRLEGDAVTLLGDCARAIPAGDPTGRDWHLSHGAQFEGLAIAAAGQGWRLELHHSATVPVDRLGHDRLEPVATASMRREVVAEDELRPWTRRRASWRGVFAPVDVAQVAALTDLGAARPDCVIISKKPDLAAISQMFDQASMHFLRDAYMRRELLQWMRLQKSGPRYHLDGLNAEAMDLSPLQARAAGLALGALFAPLDAAGLAAPVLSEASKSRSAAAIVLLHRPARESAFDAGRAFYRAWLTFEKFGFSACPMSALSDWEVSRTRLVQQFAVPADRRLICVFRIGVAGPGFARSHCRLPATQLLL